MSSLDLLSIVLAAGMGFGLARAGLCLVATTVDLVAKKNPLGCGMQALTISLMGIFLILSTLIRSGSFSAPQTENAILHVLLGASILALGFAINGGCYLGSVAYIGQGKANFLFTLVGIYLADRFSVAAAFGLKAKEIIEPLPMATAAWIGALCFMALLALAIYVLRPKWLTARKRIWGATIAVPAAALMLSLHPGWGYGATLAGLAQSGITSFGINQIAGAALFLGAIVSCVMAGLWQFQGLSALGVGRCLAGGIIMETGSQYVPGGSDTWLLWTIPSLGVHGIVAYTVAFILLLSGAWLAHKKPISVQS